MPLLTLPLGWREQAVFAAALIAIAALLNRTLHTTTITVLLMALSVFSSLRYGYWRSTQTMGRHHERRPPPAVGHDIRSPDVVSRSCMRSTTLVLGYFQTLRPLGRQPVPLTPDSTTWPSVDVFIPTYNEPLRWCGRRCSAHSRWTIPPARCAWRCWTMATGRSSGNLRRRWASPTWRARRSCACKGRKHQPRASRARPPSTSPSSTRITSRPARSCR